MTSCPQQSMRLSLWLSDDRTARSPAHIRCPQLPPISRQLDAFPAGRRNQAFIHRVRICQSPAEPCSCPVDLSKHYGFQGSEVATPSRVDRRVMRTTTRNIVGGVDMADGLASSWRGIAKPVSSVPRAAATHVHG